MKKFMEIVRKWRDAPDLTAEEKREIIERELAWAEEEEKKKNSPRGFAIALACAAMNRSKGN